MSSYAVNNYAEVFDVLIRAMRPAVCVELGILNGYSTLAIAKAIKRLGSGFLHAFDLFEEYQFKHGNMAEVIQMLHENDVRGLVNVEKEDAFKVSQRFRDDSVDLLHVDISNTGEVLYRIMDQWTRKIRSGGIILFEGGSEERDRVEWMVKHKKQPIKKELEKNLKVSEYFIYSTYMKFPSLTCLIKKG